MAKIAGDSMVIPCVGFAVMCSLVSSVDVSSLPKEFLQTENPEDT